MSTIDNRIVNMQFNNSKFESGVSQTLGTLQKLKQALKFDNRKTGLENLNKSAKNVDLSSISAGIDQVNNRFSTLSVIGRTVLQNLTNTAVNTGKSFIRYLVGGITSGGITRALNIQQARFQLEGLHADWSVMQEAINKGVEDTAYGFDEAAKAAAVMYASGIKDGNRMAETLRGISGLAAMTGSSYSDVADIVSAIAGSGKVMTEQLRQFEHRGINVAASLAKGLNKSEAEIRDMVTKGKVSFEDFSRVMNETFGAHAQDANKTFTGNLSNIKASLARIGAMFFEPGIRADETKQKYMNLVDVLQNVLKAFKTFEGFLKGSSGLKIYNNALTKVSEVASKLFDAISGDDVEKDINGNIVKVLKTQTEKWEELRKSLGLTDTTFKNIGDTFNGIVSIFKIVGHLISGIVTAFTPGVRVFGSFGEAVLSVTGSIGRFVTGLEQSIAESKAFQLIGKGIAGIFGGISDVISAFLGGFSEALTKMSGGAKTVNKITGSFLKLGEILSGIGDVIKSALSGIADIISSVFGGIADVLSSDGVNQLNNIINTVFTGGILLTLSEMQVRVANFLRPWIGFVNMGKRAITSIQSTLSAVTSVFQTMQTKVKAQAIKEIAIALAIFAGSLLVLASIEPGKLENALAGMAGLLSEVMVMILALSKMDFSNVGDIKINAIALALIGIAAAVLILAKATKQLASLNIGQLAKGLGGIGVLLTEMGVFLNATKKLKIKPKSMVGLILLAATLKILASVVHDLAQVDMEGLVKGLAGIGVMLGEMAAFAYLIKGIKINLKSMVGLIALGGAIKIIADAMKTIGSLNPEQLAGSLIGLGVLLGEIAAFMKLMSYSKGSLANAVGIYILSQAITELSGALKALSSLNEEQIANGLVAIGGALTVIAVSMRLMPKPATMLLTSVGLIAVASAISTITKSMQSLGGMSWEGIAKGLVAIGGALIVLTVAMHAMKGALSGAAAMIVMASALSILAPVLTKLGKMSWGGIAKALVALAGAFTVFGLAAALLSPVIPAMIALGAAVAVLGAGLFAAGAGISMFATGLLNIAKNATLMLESVPNLINIFSAFLDGLLVLVPKMTLFGVNMMISFLDGVRQSAPKLIEVAADLIVIFLSGFAKKIPDVVDAAFDLIEALVIAIAQGIQNFSDKIKGAGKLISAETFKAVSDALLELSAATFILSKINPVGAIKAVAALAIFANGLGLLLTELGALAQIPGLKYLIGEGGDLLAAIGGAIGKLVGGFASGVAAGFMSGLPSMAKDLSAFMTNLMPFLAGAQMLNPSVLTSIKTLASAIVAITSAKLQDSIANFLGGGSSFSEFGKELNDFVPAFKDFADQVSDIDPATVKNVKVIGNIIKALAEASATIPNEGGISAAIFGDNTLSDLAKHLGTFATEFADVAGKMAEVPKDAIVKVRQVAKAAQELASLKISNEGGMAADFLGDNTLSLFAEHLGAFGEKFASLADKLTDVPEDSIEKVRKVAKVAQVLASLEIPNQGGAVSFFTGDNDLGTLAEGLKKFGEKFAELSKSLTDVSEDSIAKVVKLSKIVSIFSKIESGNIQGVKTLQTLSPVLPDIGKNLASYANQVKKIDTSGAEKANNFIPKLFNSLSKVSGKGAGLTSIGPALASLGKAIKSYAKNVSGINGEELSKIATDISKAMTKIKNAISKADLEKTFKSTGDKAAKAFAKSISSSKDKASSNAKSLVSSVAKAMSGATSKMAEPGKKGAEAFVNGIKDKSKSASSAGKSLVSSAAKGASGSGFGSAGSDAAQGFVNGVYNKTDAAWEAGHAVGKATIAGARAALRSASPSKEMMKVGHDFDNGFIIGINELRKRVGEASYNAGEESIKSMRKAISDIPLLYGLSDISDPVIKPVLDLSNVRAGTKSISGMFDNRYALGLVAGNVQLKSMQGLQLAAANANAAPNNTYTITNHITVSGAENPTAWADEFMQELEVQARKY